MKPTEPASISASNFIPVQDLHDGVTFDRFSAVVDHHPRAKIHYDPSHICCSRWTISVSSIGITQRIAAFHVKDAEFIPSAVAGSMAAI